MIALARPTSRCLDAGVVQALFEQRLSPREIDTLDLHTSDCVPCRDLVRALAGRYVGGSPSCALEDTASLLDANHLTGAPAAESSVKRLLARLACETYVGRIFAGKWRLDAVLGAGGMAEVYAATHLTNGRRAAIKVLRREWLARPDVVYRFLREGYVANRISHPGVVTILDDGTTEDGIPFLVLELLEGHSIDVHLSDRLPIPTVLWIAGEVLDVVASAHDRDVVHRDIKPDNVFLTKKGTIKLLDFGIARVHEQAAGGERRDTQCGTLMGTPAFMPPEQARGKWDEVDGRTDVWAVGATMFALLTGRPVRSGGTPNEILAAAMKEPAPKLANVAPHVPAAVCELVDRALALRPADRFPDARTMQLAVRAALRCHPSVADTYPPVSVFVTATPEAGSESRSRGPTVAALVMAAIMIVGGIAGMRWRAGRSTAVQAKTEVAPSHPAAVPSAPAEPVSAPGPVVVPPVPPTAEPAARPKAVRRAAPRRVELVPEPAAPAAAPPAAPAVEEHPLDRRD